MWKCKYQLCLNTYTLPPMPCLIIIKLQTCLHTTRRIYLACFWCKFPSYYLLGSWQIQSICLLLVCSRFRWVCYNVFSKWNKRAMANGDTISSISKFFPSNSEIPVSAFGDIFLEIYFQKVDIVSSLWGNKITICATIALFTDF